MLPWVHEAVQEIDEVFAGDPWPYGIEANRRTLEALVQYMAEQHLIARMCRSRICLYRFPQGWVVSCCVRAQRRAD